ncbi:heparinase [Variovorax sp. Root473]|nr:heparinase [Variovorax sp. Root473]
MNGLRIKIRTAAALGLSNIGRAVSYRIGVKLGLNPVRRLKSAVAGAPFFRPTFGAPTVVPVTANWEAAAQLFSHWPFNVTAEPPDWLANPFSGQRIAVPEREWWQIPDFDPATGDIKLIWELSRMDWVLAFAQRARNGDAEALNRLNNWLSDWCARNPPFRGPNWKCGQEASLRVMHLAMSALVLDQVRRPLPGLLHLVHAHLQRIAPTLQYAMAQDNNHGTSEAAALFIGGNWLALEGVTAGVEWARIGRRWLENRATRLIGSQGTFSQYSLNYHRVMLDTFCMAEVWRRHLALPAFSESWQTKALAATQWLRHMVSPLNGDGPNVGANDGARLLQLVDAPYRDHRPTVQTAMALFADQRAYAEDGPWNTSLQWLGIPLPDGVAPTLGHYVADDGGFAVLHCGGAMAMLRYPRFRFRPSQADALHLDLWLDGQNLLRDAGTYSYNTEPQWQNYFAGTAGHNTVQFDGRDQMPRLSRFLFGNWLKTQWLEPLSEDAVGAHYAAGYRDDQGASHRRRISLGNGSLRVQDEVAGFMHRAVLRWRLAPGSWELIRTPETVHLVNRHDGVITLNVQASMVLVRCELVEGWESRHYLEKTPVPVLEIEIQQPGTLTTDVRWAV